MARQLSLDASVFRVQIKHILPNAVTIMALSFGLTALMLAGEGLTNAAIGCILIAALLDACDGKVARATGGTSKFGAELDSLADVVCFGAVPAFLMFKTSLSGFGPAGWAACLLFQAASALRLARFNVTAAVSDPPSWVTHFFRGIPAPAGAFLVTVPLYAENAGWLSPDDASRLALFTTVLIAFLMVSSIPTFSSKALSRRALRLYFLPSLALAIAAIIGLIMWPWETLVIASGLYLLSLPLSYWRHSIYMKRTPVA